MYFYLNGCRNALKVFSILNLLPFTYMSVKLVFKLIHFIEQIYTHLHSHLKLFIYIYTFLLFIYKDIVYSQGFWHVQGCSQQHNMAGNQQKNVIFLLKKSWKILPVFSRLYGFALHTSNGIVIVVFKPSSLLAVFPTDDFPIFTPCWAPPQDPDIPWLTVALIMLPNVRTPE